MKTGRISLLALCLSIPGYAQTAAGKIEAFGLTWNVPEPEDWAYEHPVLHLRTARPQEKPRRPRQFALADTAPWLKVTLELEARSPEGHLILVFGYRDESHFNYAHLSVDKAAEQPVHNGIFHVYGGDRVRISREIGPAALSQKNVWHKIKLEHDASTGSVRVAIDGGVLPAFEAFDLSLGPGRIGIGSFFNTASFRNIKLSGTPPPRQ